MIRTTVRRGDGKVKIVHIVDNLLLKVTIGNRKLPLVGQSVENMIKYRHTRNGSSARTIVINRTRIWP